MTEVDPVSQTLAYVRIIKPQLGDKPITESVLGEIEALPEIKEQLTTAGINLALLRQSAEGKFLASVQRVSHEQHAAEVESKISTKYDFLHRLTHLIVVNLDGKPIDEYNFLDTLRRLVSTKDNDSEPRKTFIELQLDPDSDLTLQVIAERINEQWCEFDETIKEINRLAANLDTIFACGNVAKHLRKADYLYKYKDLTVDTYFEKKNEPMNQFFTNAFIVFKALEKGQVSDSLTEEEYRKDPSVSYYDKIPKEFEHAVVTLLLLLERAEIKQDVREAIRGIAQSLYNFQVGINFLQEIEKAVKLLNSSTDEQFQAVADNSLSQITETVKLTEENKATVTALFEGIKNARQEKKAASEKARASALISKSSDSDKGFWKNWGNWLVVGIGALAFIGAFLTGSEDSKLGKIIAGLGLGAVIGGLVAKFHTSLSWLFGVEEGVKQAKPQGIQLAPVPQQVVPEVAGGVS